MEHSSAGPSVDATSANTTSGCLLAIGRAVASLVLGVIVFVGMVYFVVLTGISAKLLDTGFYTAVLDDSDSYDRLYEVTAQEILRQSESSLVGIYVPGEEEVSDLLRQVAPRSYVQSQAESNIELTLLYLNGDADVIEPRIEMQEPLERVGPVLIDYIQGRIDGLEEVDIGQAECSPSAVREFAEGYRQRYRQLAGGDIPTTVPSLTALDGLCRRGVFEAVYAVLVNFQQSEGRDLDSLADSRDELRQSFDDADARGALKVMVEALAGPVIDEEIEIARTELGLDQQDRLELIGFLAKEDDDLTEEEIRTGLADARDLVGRIHGMGRVVALVLVIVGSIVMGLLYFRNTAGMARWPGVTLLSAGLVCLIVGLVLESQVPGSLEGAVGLDVGLSSTATDWITDVVTTVGERLFTGFTGSAVIFIAVGAALFVASFLLPRLRRSMPGSEEGDGVDRGTGDVPKA